MNKNLVLGLLVIIIVLGLALYSAKRSQDVLEKGLPPREMCDSQDDAFNKANNYALAHRIAAGYGKVHDILGTGSMAPYIPAALPGEDPMTTTVAYVVEKAGGKYEDITPGVPVFYRAKWLNGALVLHGAALQDKDGWVMSGLHNAHSEPYWRVDKETFVGIAERTFVWERKPGKP